MKVTTKKNSGESKNTFSVLLLCRLVNPTIPVTMNRAGNLAFWFLVLTLICVTCFVDNVSTVDSTNSVGVLFVDPSSSAFHMKRDLRHWPPKPRWKRRGRTFNDQGWIMTFLLYFTRVFGEVVSVLAEDVQK